MFLIQHFKSPKCEKSDLNCKLVHPLVKEFPGYEVSLLGWRLMRHEGSAWNGSLQDEYSLQGRNLS